LAWGVLANAASANITRIVGMLTTVRVRQT
jgi:hypothetical protein